MADTYSLAIKGHRSDSFGTLTNLTIGDSSALVPDQAQAMMFGTQVLCKQPDGSSAWYTFDAERSTPAFPVLLKV